MTGSILKTAYSCGMIMRLSRTFLGSASLERECEGFEVGLRRATVPPDAVPEHSHETAHLTLAIDQGYQNRAVGAASWPGPAMLVYNPPGTIHRDRFAETGGRFVAIDLPMGSEPAGIVDAIVLRSGVARAAVGRVTSAMLSNSSELELEDALLALPATLIPRPAGDSLPPSWLAIVLEALEDLADDASLRVSSLAEIAGIHPVHLARTFATHVGCSPGEAIRRTRLERVAARLIDRQPLVDLATDHGFADQAHLTRCFRAAYGTTPSSFRAAFS